MPMSKYCKEIMEELVYTRIISENDPDVARLYSIYKLPEVSQFINVSDNYFNYVTNTPNVYFYKVCKSENLVGAIHLEKCEKTLYLDILIFPEYQKMGLATRVIEDIKNDIFNFGYERIEISIDEKNAASINLFKNAGFAFVSKEDELLNYIYKKG